MARPARIRGWLGVLALLLALAGCSEPQEGGAPTPTDRSSPNLSLTRRLLTFQEHELALTELVSQRAGSDTVRALARRSQQAHEPQARALRAWQERRRAGSTSATGSSARPSGLASSDEMAELANATGAGFDRLFLALMTRHHEHVLLALQSETESASTVPQALIDEIRVLAQSELDELRMTLARSPE